MIVLKLSVPASQPLAFVWLWLFTWTVTFHAWFSMAHGQPGILDLAYLLETAERCVQVISIAGHSAHPFNDLVDSLAKICHAESASRMDLPSCVSIL